MKLVIAALLAFAAPAAAQTRLVLLGTGNPNPNPERSGPSVAIVAGGSVYLVDAGPGLVRRAEAARRAGIAELAQPNLRTVFITHLHSDHTLGLPDLLLTPWVLERSAPLAVFGPPGTRDMVRRIREAWRVDIARRQDGWQPHNRTGHEATVTEIREGLIYSDSNVRVFAALVPHGNWPDAFAYRFEARDRVIVVSGDTRAADAIVDLCRGCDVLVHEVYSDSGFATLPPDWQRYHSAFHTSATDLAALATRARPGMLVLYHQLSWGGVPLDTLLAEVRRGYGGRVVNGRDLDVY
ncbi:MAG TPA: MBL fold metallo-hydrolase [Gemmatimonadales bacterium]|nr:MBL fold metallo-hydrolase [Gemmatimonadales bacterium]